VLSRAVSSLVLGLLAVSALADDAGPHLGTGLKIGEVTDRSVIIWTRLTAAPKPNAAELGKVPPQRVEDDVIPGLPAASPGVAGDVLLSISSHADFASAKIHPLAHVTAATDFTQQWKLDDFQPATKYHVRVAALNARGQQTSHLEGSFVTAPRPEQWQDIRFAVMSCQSHKDRDDIDGFHIYPAMQKQGLQFYVATGDDVYYDSDPPLATTVAMARFHWNRMYGLPLLVDFHRQVPGYWEKDDHDSYRNDGWPPQGQGGDASEKLEGALTFWKGLRVFREQNPLGEKPYRTFRWGKGLQIWLTEGRDFRSPNNVPDGPNKTIWGREQLEWLKSSILASDADFKVLASPTPIVGPDRGNKADNHANQAFAHEGNAFRDWTQANKLTNFFVCNGDRHWQYHSVDPKTGLNEFGCGPASDVHASGSPGLDQEYHKFHRVKGGFLTISVSQVSGAPAITFRHHDVEGSVVYEKAFRRMADK
jgi:alkaline phosphatase D